MKKVNLGNDDHVSTNEVSIMPQPVTTIEDMVDGLDRVFESLLSSQGDGIFKVEEASREAFLGKYSYTITLATTVMSLRADWSGENPITPKEKSECRARLISGIIINCFKGVSVGAEFKEKYSGVTPITRNGYTALDLAGMSDADIANSTEDDKIKNECLCFAKDIGESEEWAIKYYAFRINNRKHKRWYSTNEECKIMTIALYGAALEIFNDYHHESINSPITESDTISFFVQQVELLQYLDCIRKNPLGGCKEPRKNLNNKHNM